jgi:hypothetical protein
MLIISGPAENQMIVTLGIDLARFPQQGTPQNGQLATIQPTNAGARL